MKKQFLHILIISLLITTWWSCKKNELDPDFKALARMSLTANDADGARADSLVFSFAIWPAALTDTQVNVFAQVMGNLEPRERVYKLVVDESSTALPAEYEIPDTFVMPAGSFRVGIPVLIKRAARLQNASAKLVLRIDENENFLPGPVLQVGLVNSGPSFTVIWTDELTKPAFWDQSGAGMIWTVGKWSKVKHQLIIDATGIRNFEGASTADRYYIASKTLEYLVDYNANNPGNPLRNENGLVIDICSQCE